MMNKLFIIFIALVIALGVVRHGYSYDVVNPEDFTFLGAFKSPVAFGTGLTIRYINGDLYFYSLIYAGTGTGHLHRFQAPASLSTTAPFTATGINNTDYGDIFQNELVDVCSNGTGYDAPMIGLSGHAQVPTSLFWDSINQKMYWNKIIGYQTCTLQPDGYPYTNPSIGYSVLNDSVPSGTGIGSWYPSPNYYATEPGWMGNRWDGMMLLLPRDFATTYTGGKPFAIGGGGTVSVTTSGPASDGPTLFAISDVNPAAQANQGLLANTLTPMLGPFYFDSGNELPLPAWAYFQYAGALAPFELQTTWPHVGTPFNFNSGVFVQGATKWGIIFFSNLPMGNTTTAISASPAPTSQTFTLDNIGDIVVGSLIRIADQCAETSVCNSVTPYSPTYPYDVGVVQSISGNQVTLQNALPVIPNAGSAVYTGVWYNGGGPEISNFSTPWIIYDPSQIGAIALDPVTNPPTGISPSYFQNFQYPGVSYPVQGATTNGLDGLKTTLHGATFDPITNNIYILMSQGTINPPIIYVYHLNDELSANWDWAVQTNGACGTASGQSFVSLTANSPNLCTTGTVASFTGTGPWTWGCDGSGGGTSTGATACTGSFLQSSNITTTRSAGRATGSPFPAVTLTCADCVSMLWCSEVTQGVACTPAVTYSAPFKTPGQNRSWFGYCYNGTDASSNTSSTVCVDGKREKKR